MQSPPTANPTQVPTQVPTLPSAKPSRPFVQTVGLLSVLMSVAGLGLSFTAIDIYRYRSQQRLNQRDQIAALEQQAEINQRSAQLQRNQSAPVWINQHAYDPNATYTLDGTTQTEVPVLVGTERDTAVCVGTIGPDGFTQNPSNPLCLGY